MRNLFAWGATLAVSLLLTLDPALADAVVLWPALAAVGVILVTRQAVSGLAAGVVAGCVLLADGAPLEALRLTLRDHVFPALDGPWHVGALVFTLLLGAFAGVLEASGGFVSLLERITGRGKNPDRRVLGSVYGLGLLCFFDGLANAMLIGRVGRQAADRSGISREKLAWVVDSTSSPVACVAFISTWIATQITLIHDSLPTADAYGLYFRSIPANPYCLLTLLLVPLAIYWRWEPRPMRRYQPETAATGEDKLRRCEPWRVLVPLVVLAISIALSFQLWSGNPIDLFSLTAWREAASGAGGPMALVGGALAGLAGAWFCYPSARRSETGEAALRGAAGLLPALVVLILAWSLGSVFRDLGAGARLKELLGGDLGVGWLPLAVFGVASLTAFATGSSWGTMGLLMPLALELLPAGTDAATLTAIAPPVIGAVFGGAVFGDHCSPFSDTTIVSALAAGCRPLDHVLSQLPYALTTALAAAIAYVLIALHFPPVTATLCAAGLLALTVFTLRGRPAPIPSGQS